MKFRLETNMKYFLSVSKMVMILLIYRIRSMSSKQWLQRNGLVARKLTLLDALAPTMIPHRSKYVPILDKHVLAKVFDEVNHLLYSLMIPLTKDI